MATAADKPPTVTKQLSTDDKAATPGKPSVVKQPSTAKTTPASPQNGVQAAAPKAHADGKANGVGNAAAPKSDKPPVTIHPHAAGTGPASPAKVAVAAQPKKAAGGT